MRRKPLALYLGALVVGFTLTVGPTALRGEGSLKVLERVAFAAITAWVLALILSYSSIRWYLRREGTPAGWRRSFTSMFHISFTKDSGSVVVLEPVIWCPILWIMLTGDRPSGTEDMTRFPRGSFPGRNFVSTTFDAYNYMGNKTVVEHLVGDREGADTLGTGGDHGGGN